MKLPKRAYPRGEQGSIMIWAALAMTVLIGITGLAMDAGQMFVTKQKAQAAADAAVLAGVLDMYNGTTVGGGVYGTTTTCSTTSAWTPCYYARQNGFGGTANDTVTVDFTTSGGTSKTCTVPAGLGGSLSAIDNPSVICVTASRVVNTTLMKVMGQNNSTVSATAIAAIVLGPSPLPIVVTHPHLVDAFQLSGGATVTITGGPSRAIQIDSDGTINSNGHTAGTPEAFQVSNNSSVDLSKAGPNSSGADFRSWGPAYSHDTVATITTMGACSTWLCLGSSGHYVDPGSIITDPLAQLTQPSQPASNGTVANIANGKSLGVSGCTATCTSAGGCQTYTPGLYTGGIQVKGANLVTAYFYPGLYYIVDSKTSKNNVGFQGASGSDMEMLSSVCTVSNDANTGSGMVVFNSGSSVFTVGSNGNANLTGPAFNNSTYEGILFWEDRTLNPGAVVAHSFGGGGTLTLTGTIYANMPNANVTNKNYQSVTVGGHAGSTTKIVGEIITNVLTISGSAGINMQLTTQQVQNARQIALVQ